MKWFLIISAGWLVAFIVCQIVEWVWGQVMWFFFPRKKNEATFEHQVAKASADEWANLDPDLCKAESDGSPLTESQRILLAAWLEKVVAKAIPRYVAIRAQERKEAG